MAKKNKASELFSKFTSNVEKNVKNVELMGFADIDEYIPTGNYLLNAQMSGSLFGGYPNARSLGIAGDPGTGKTFLCMNAAREAQQKGYLVFYIDTEGALDSKNFEDFGVDMDLLKYYRLGTVTDIKLTIAGIIKTIKQNQKEGIKVIIFIDSLGQLETTKEQADIEKGKEAGDMGLKAKQLRALFRSFTLQLSNLKVPLIFTNHVYDGTDIFSSKSMSGGGGPLFSASVVLFLGKKVVKEAVEGEEGKVKTGVLVRSKTHKNRLARMLDIEFHISFYKGMNPYVGLEQYIGWDECGVGRGSIIDKNQYDKLSDKDKEKCSAFEVDKETVYFQPNDRARNFILRHSGEKVPIKELWSDKVFTPEVLKELDENVIQPRFKFPTMKDLLEAEASDLEAGLDDEDED